MKNLATLFHAFQELVWEGGEHYDTWENAVDTAKTMGARLEDKSEDEYLAIFPDGSSAVIYKSGAGIVQTFEAIAA